MGNSIAEVIEVTQDRFVSIQPKWMNYDAEKGFAIQILKGNDFLMGYAKANPTSLQQALTNVAAIGLSLNPAAKEAYLIPRSFKENNQWIGKVCLEPSYMGLVKLATDSGSIMWAQANSVHAQDTFEDNGPGSKPSHKYQAFSASRGEMVGFYCVAKTKDGDFLTETMTLEEIHSVRERSESWKRGKPGKKGPWETDFKEQAKKTVVRRAFKLWPKTDHNRMAQAVEMSNQNEGFEPLVSSPSINQCTPEQKEYFDQLITKNDDLGMFVFLSSIDEGLQLSLHQSFNKGEKGKYQKLVLALKEAGRDKFLETITLLQQAMDSNDDPGCKEIMAECDQETQDLIYERLSYEYSRALKEAVND